MWIWDYFIDPAGAQETVWLRAAILVRSQRPYTLLILDIGHFKRINDTCGHPAGDKVLQSVADICSDAVRNGDLVGRWGGEEFVVLLLEAEIGKSQHVAERILSRVASAAVEVPGHQAIRLTVSIAVAADGANLDELIVHADQALYRAKQEGHNRPFEQSAAAA